MAELGALNELQNQQRPARRNDRTYGKKKAPTAEKRAMHFDLFGGGVDENEAVRKADAPEDDEKIVNEMERLTIKVPGRDIPLQPAPEPTFSIKQKSTEHNPRLRGRRKPISQKKMATLTPEKLQALDPLLKIVEQHGVKDFQEFGRSIGKKYLCTKLGEGSYADVYELQPKDANEAQELETRGGLIIKVIPFRVESTSKDDIADLDAITREIQLFQTVDALHGFVRCRGIHIVSGAYPDVLLEAFSTFTLTHTAESAQNFDPSVTASRNKPLYAILEMNHAGTPLGKLGRSRPASSFQVFDIFWKTAISLAHAEREVQFEHRDLHNGNICWKSLTGDGQLDVKQEVIEEMEEKPAVILGLSNLEVTIIDYTLSRATVGDMTIFDPMKYWDHDYEEVEGDSEGDKRQFKTYAAVRDLVTKAEAEAMALAQLEGADYKAINKYERFVPKSNVLWLKYVLADLLARGGGSGGGRGAYVPGSSKAAKKLQLEMWEGLEEVEAYLKGTTATLLPTSADDFIGMAVEKGWLAEGDVAAFKAQTEQ
ncbi:non-specific protein-tyrosine kinase [Cladophialophora carrionii]|uniref:Non-specific protein-tyrosine kinase n=1 Tax=Cladophialophora carrionii TaxID=86049 RepID=A0A1C1C6H7_9EURO|nr:non-specific protein-tyrosine kinase [Cladophialophora carrionii]